MLQSKNAYAIMPLGKNDVSVHVGHVKKPGAATLGFSIPFGQGGLGWLPLIVSIQPFAYIPVLEIFIGIYEC